MFIQYTIGLLVCNTMCENCDGVTNQLVTAVTGAHAATSLPHPAEPELQELLPALAEPAEVIGDANHDTCTIC